MVLTANSQRLDVFVAISELGEDQSVTFDVEGTPAKILVHFGRIRDIGAYSISRADVKNASTAFKDFPAQAANAVIILRDLALRDATPTV